MGMMPFIRRREAAKEAARRALAEKVAETPPPPPNAEAEVEAEAPETGAPAADKPAKRRHG